MTPPLKLSALNATAERLGARWQELAGWRCAQAYGDAGAEAAAARAGAGLADVSALGKIQIEGRQASTVLSAALGAAPGAVGGHARVAAGDLYGLRPDMYFLRTAPGAELAALAALETAAAAHPDLVTVTDVTHGLAGIELVGPRAVDVLTRVCGLDFSPVSFPVDAARQTSVAKTRQLILHHTRGGLPSYTLFGARSLAAYLWGVLLEAGQPFGLTPVGQEALSALEAPREAAA
jgi:heterotetrameric sarcosine oxidase gamma subunit